MIRLFYNSTEITKEVERLDTSVFEMSYVPGDYIYVASDFPFNNLFIKLGTTVNLIPASMNIEYWANPGWNEVVELRDETNALSSSGYIEFTPNKNSAWVMDEDSTNLGLSKTVYYKYWTRISFNQTLTASIDLSFIGNKFSDDSDLFEIYPIFNNSDFLTAYKAGKTNWEEQHIQAAKEIVSDLTKKSVIMGAEQILERRKFISASVRKVAEIIYNAFGNDYVEQKRMAKEDYFLKLDLSQYAIDTNQDAILQPYEVKTRQGWMSR